jgi:ketosteroid isomerase-like protein
MTPKEVVKKHYECFATGDMETFRTLYAENAVVKVNGIHKLSGTYHGPDNWMNALSDFSKLLDDFKIIELVNIIAEGEKVFAMLHVTAVGSGKMEANFGHFFRIENGKITEFHAFDDSQKLAATMHAA